MEKRMLYNGQHGGFGFSNEFLKHFGISGGTYSREGMNFSEDLYNRTNPKVFEVIDKIGLERSSGDCCKLHYIEIDEDDIYTLEEFDGKENLKYVGRAKHNLLY